MKQILFFVLLSALCPLALRGAEIPLQTSTQTSAHKTTPRSEERKKKLAHYKTNRLLSALDPDALPVCQNDKPHFELKIAECLAKQHCTTPEPEETGSSPIAASSTASTTQQASLAPTEPSTPISALSESAQSSQRSSTSSVSARSPQSPTNGTCPMSPTRTHYVTYKLSPKNIKHQAQATTRNGHPVRVVTTTNGSGTTPTTVRSLEELMALPIPNKKLAPLNRVKN